MGRFTYLSLFFGRLKTTSICSVPPWISFPIPPSQPGCEVHGLPELSEFGAFQQFDESKNVGKLMSLDYHIYIVGVSKNRATPHFTPQVLMIFSTKNHGFVGETHHFWKHPHRYGCSISKRINDIWLKGDSDDTELRSAMSDFRIGVSPAVEALKLGKNIERNKWLLFFSGDFLFGLETFVYLR